MPYCAIPFRNNKTPDVTRYLPYSRIHRLSYATPWRDTMSHDHTRTCTHAHTNMPCHATMIITQGQIQQGLCGSHTKKPLTNANTSQLMINTLDKESANSATTPKTYFFGHNEESSRLDTQYHTNWIRGRVGYASELSSLPMSHPRAPIHTHELITHKHSHKHTHTRSLLLLLLQPTTILAMTPTTKAMIKWSPSRKLQQIPSRSYKGMMKKEKGKTI